jgi:hypothetical protein
VAGGNRNTTCQWVCHQRVCNTHCLLKISPLRTLPRRDRFGGVIQFRCARAYSHANSSPVCWRILRKPSNAQEQYTRGLACTGTIRGLVGTAAISCTSLLRVASLNCSRCLIAMTKDPGPPMTQSS